MMRTPVLAGLALVVCIGIGTRGGDELNIARTIAPSGMTFYTANLFPAWKGSLFIGGLQSTNLVRLDISGEKVTGEERLLGNVNERIRDVTQGPDGALYLLTDNAKGRLLKVVPKK
jgi:glucose/arabinose dehydrogenase